MQSLKEKEELISKAMSELARRSWKSRRKKFTKKEISEQMKKVRKGLKLKAETPENP